MAVTPLDMLQARAADRNAEIHAEFPDAPYSLPAGHFGSHRTPTPRRWGVTVIVDLADLGPSRVFIPKDSKDEAVAAAANLMAQATDPDTSAMGLDDGTTTLWVRADLILATHVSRG